MQLSQHPLIHSTCGYDDISVITPVLSIYLSTTSAVFTPAGHVNILQMQQSGWFLYFVLITNFTGVLFLWSLWEFSICTIYSWYHRHSHVTCCFLWFGGKVQMFVILFSFISTLWSSRTAKFTRWQVFFNKECYVFWFVHIPFSSMVKF